MRTTRRRLMAGALVVPGVAALASWRWDRGTGSVLLHDPSLEAGRRFAEAGRAASGRVLALEGDPIRLARTVLAGQPALVAGVSRHADALLFEEAAGEAGYIRVAAFDGNGERCTTAACRNGWQMVAKLTENAGAAWAEALAGYAARAGHAGEALPARSPHRIPHPSRAFGWLLARA